MGEEQGFCILVTGCILVVGYAVRIAWSDTDIGENSLLQWLPDVYWIILLPLLTFCTLGLYIILYTLANINAAPDPWDYRCIVDIHGAKRRDIHGICFVDDQHQTPFVTDISTDQMNAQGFY